MRPQAVMGSDIARVGMNYLDMLESHFAIMLNEEEKDTKYWKQHGINCSGLKFFDNSPKSLRDYRRLSGLLKLYESIGRTGRAPYYTAEAFVVAQFIDQRLEADDPRKIEIEKIIGDLEKHIAAAY